VKLSGEWRPTVDHDDPEEAPVEVGDLPGLLLCGGTGDLGGRIATRLAQRGIPFRALVRPGSDAAALRAAGAQLVTGDLTDRASLDRAMTRATTVITTANAIGRMLSGTRDLSIDAVDRDGNVSLVRAAEAAGVQRFVFVSAAGLSDGMVARAPFAAAKRHVEDVLQDSPMESVIVQPAPFQEFWSSAEAGLRPDKRRAVIYGRGRAPVNYVAVDDVAEACVRLAVHADPPPVLELGGPEALTRHDVVDACEAAWRARFRRITVPRQALALGAGALRRRRPAIASVMGMSLTMDLEGVLVDPEGLQQLGIEPRAMTAHIAEMARASTVAGR
jgi:uncharacterized protein YbjT (DUF2867 family)